MGIVNMPCLAAIVALMQAAAWAAQAETAVGPRDDFTWMRGANYVPSYARNDVQIWMDYDPAAIDRELGYARKMGLNTVRVFLQYAVYEKDPKMFLDRFENFLALCARHRIVMMPVIFDSCFGEFPDLEKYREKDWMASPGQNRLGQEHWPKLEQYVRQVVGAHKDDKRIVMWDVMNEPTCTSFNKPEDRKLIWTFLDHFLDYVKREDPNHPLTVGLMASSELPQVVAKVDVLGFHNYTSKLREDIRGVMEIARKHGKPAVINEVVRRDSQPFAYAMPILREEKIGWCIWELMLGNTQFSRGENPVQGVVYADGTCRDAADVAAVMGISEDEAKKLFPERSKPKKEDEGVTYVGYWTRWTGKGPRKDRLHYTNAAGSAAAWTFAGTGAAMIHKVGPDCGIARILIDGKLAVSAEIDTYSPTVEWNRRTVIAQGLPHGQHVVTVEVTGRKNEKSTNTYVQIVEFGPAATEPSSPKSDAATLSAAGDAAIDAATLDAWSAKFRNWHYWPDHVIPANPGIEGFPDIQGTDVPTVYQIPGNPKWYMTFIGFDGKGYQSFVAESADLVHWKQRGLAMGYGPKDAFDHGGCVVGAYLYESYDLKAPRRLKRYQGKYWTLYGAYPRQGGYELRPGYEGVAWSDDGLHWKRAKDKYILSVFEPDRGEWEKDCIYQPWLVEHEGRFYDFYNAAGGHAEQTGIAFSTDLLNWSRYAGNPVLRNRRGGYDEQFCSDPKVFRDGDHWVMFYFGVGRGGAHIMVAFSRDLLHWTAHAEPLYKAGGNPSGLDKQYAHKISLVYDPANDTFLMFYNAVPGKRGTTGGRGIGLISSRPLASDGSPGAGGR